MDGTRLISRSVWQSSRLPGEFEPDLSDGDFKPSLRKKKAFRLSAEGFLSSQIGATGFRFAAPSLRYGVNQRPGVLASLARGRWFISRGECTTGRPYRTCLLCIGATGRTSNRWRRFRHTCWRFSTALLLQCIKFCRPTVSRCGLRLPAGRRHQCA